VRIQIIDFHADFCMHEKCMMLLYLTFINFVDVWAQTSILATFASSYTC
jgi:hypothetical protein